MRVGFIGLGDIGMPMCERLVEAHFDVVASDLDDAKTKRLAGRGAMAARAVADFADCRVVGLAVPDDATVRSVLLDDGLLETLGRDAVVLIHSTILPTTAQELQEHASAAGVFVVDAPVSGGAARARAGDLVVMLGGDAKAIGLAGPVLDALSRESFHAGASGTGAALKLVNQLAMLASLAAIQEGMELAVHYGISPDLVLGALAEGTGDSWVVRNWGFFDDLARAYDANGVAVRFRPWSKDLWDVVASARSADVRVPLAATMSQYLADAVEQHAANASDEERSSS
jgi:3-hydroxyisobutyrate dehydrogenase